MEIPSSILPNKLKEMRLGYYDSFTYRRHHHVGDYHGMDEPVVSLNNYPFETMDIEEAYKLRSEKCLISLAKTCNLKRFCYAPDSKKDLVPIIVGKNKIEGGKCPGLKENIYSFNVTDGNQYDECKRYECSYCEEGASKVSEYVSFFSYTE